MFVQLWSNCYETWTDRIKAHYNKPAYRRLYYNIPILRDNSEMAVLRDILI